jgi:hypothetical protein
MLRRSLTALSYMYVDGWIKLFDEVPMPTIAGGASLKAYRFESVRWRPMT